MFKCGLNLQFKGFTLMFVFVSVIPLYAETVIVSFVGRSLFYMPNDASVALGCMLAPAGTPVIIPVIANMMGKGFGNDKGIN